MKELSLQNISSRMGEEVILHSVSLTMERGERLCLLGPSGCGKTTLLRIVAGLDPCHGGEVLFRDKPMKGLAPHKRNFGMMFQDFALFPHRNVFQNIAFGLEMKKQTQREIQRRVAQMLELVGLSDHGDRQITELSGGERQRVALARTLAPSPDLIMLDEPLGALDRLLRERLLADLCTILEKTRMTTILVTHDQQEAFAVAHRICVMSQGRVEQMDVPVRLYNHPRNRTVADFLGFQNIVDKGVSFSGDGDVTIIHENGVFRFTTAHAMDKACDRHRGRAQKSMGTHTSVGTHTMDVSGGGPKESAHSPGEFSHDRDGNREELSVLFLPDGGTLVWDEPPQAEKEAALKKENKEEIYLLSGRTPHRRGENIISGILEASFFQGGMVRIRVNTLFGRRFSFDVPARGRLPVRGEPVTIAIDPESIRLI